MRVGVRMNNGDYRAYIFELDEPYANVIKLVLKEVPGAVRALVLVPKREKFKFVLPEKVSA